MQYYTVPSAAALVSCHPQTIGDAIRAGKLHGVQRSKGGHWKVEESCLQAWVENRPCQHQGMAVAA